MVFYSWDVCAEAISVVDAHCGGVGVSDECKWCVYNGGACKESERVRKACDFRTLPFEKDAIIARMREEKEFLARVVKEKSSATEDDLRIAMDKAAGMVIMSKVLMEKFGVKKEELQRELGSKELSWSERMKLALAVKMMQKKERQNDGRLVRNGRY